jgi:hypothetical protein
MMEFLLMAGFICCINRWSYLKEMETNERTAAIVEHRYVTQELVVLILGLSMALFMPILGRILNPPRYVIGPAPNTYSPPATAFQFWIVYEYLLIFLSGIYVLFLARRFIRMSFQKDRTAMPKTRWTVGFVVSLIGGCAFLLIVGAIL